MANRGDVFLIVLLTIILILFVLALIGYLSGRWDMDVAGTTSLISASAARPPRSG